MCSVLFAQENLIMIFYYPTLRAYIDTSRVSRFLYASSQVEKGRELLYIF